MHAVVAGAFLKKVRFYKMHPVRNTESSPMHLTLMLLVGEVEAERGKGKGWEK